MGCLNSKKKKKEKEKEKEAIRLRSMGVQSVMKRAKGGVSYELTLDSRPLTPFRPLTPRVEQMAMLSEEEISRQMDEALVRKELALCEKTKFARAESAKRQAAKCRKLDQDIDDLICEYGISVTSPGVEDGPQRVQTSSA